MGAAIEGGERPRGCLSGGDELVGRHGLVEEAGALGFLGAEKDAGDRAAVEVGPCEPVASELDPEPRNRQSDRDLVQPDSEVAPRSNSIVGRQPLLVAASLLFPIGNIPDSAAIAGTANALFVVALWPLGITWLRQSREARIESESNAGSVRPAGGVA